jgi:hypothetical protein
VMVSAAEVRLAPCALRRAAQHDARELAAGSAPSARGCCAVLARSEAPRACASEQAPSGTPPLPCPGGRGAARAFERAALILVWVSLRACEQAAWQPAEGGRVDARSAGTRQAALDPARRRGSERVVRVLQSSAPASLSRCGATRRAGSTFQAVSGVAGACADIVGLLRQQTPAKPL